MAQADQTVQNNTFPTVRADINNNLAALFSKNSGATAPSTTVAYMDWIDTSGANPVWKKRNAANNAWITLGTIVSNTIALEGTLPSQSGNSGKYLTTNGTSASWGAISLSVDVQEFTSNGTWTKPGSGTVALIRCWGGGGSGGRGDFFAGGGGGGACVERWMKLSDLGATATVTIGAGGIAPTVTGPGNVGGTTTFGSHVSAYGGGGGGGGANNSVYGGGGGGGSLSAGATTTTGTSGAGGSGHGNVTTGSSLVSPYDQRADWGGGGGGLFVLFGSSAGGTSLWGGGGGGGAASGTGGAGGSSLNGGSGSAGDTATAGGFPGGGSGGRVGAIPGAGGAGYCIVIVY